MASNAVEFLLGISELALARLSAFRDDSRCGALGAANRDVSHFARGTCIDRVSTRSRMKRLGNIEGATRCGAQTTDDYR